MNSIIDVLGFINSQGYDDIDDYCNATGQNIDDICPDPDDDWFVQGYDNGDY